MERLIERCAGLMCTRHRSPRRCRCRANRVGADRDQDVSRHHRGAGAAGGLAGQLRGHACRDGVDRVYWKPVYYLLEDGFEVWAAECSAPQERAWTQDGCGRLGVDLPAGRAWAGPPSFVPPKPIRELRDLTRYRKALLAERTREVQRLHKVLEDAGIKLASVGGDPLGVSSQAMLEALVAGTHDPGAGGAGSGAAAAKLPALQEALQGRWGPSWAAGRGDAGPHRPAGRDDRAPERGGGPRGRPFLALLGLLMTIPGVNRRTAEVIVAEIGSDMGRFPTAAHLASWAGVCPGNNESAGKHGSGRTCGSKGCPAMMIRALRSA